MNADTLERDREIRAAPEGTHWSELAERYNLSRSSVYRIQGAPDPSPIEAFAPRSAVTGTTFRSRRGNRDAFSQIAVSGLTRHGGAVTEEFQRELQADGGAKLYAQMATHPVVSAVLFAIRMSLRRVRWWFEPAADDDAARADAEFAEGCRTDMSQAWSEIMSQAFSTMLKYGYSLCELVYKLRQGQVPRKYIADPARSRYSDGRVGWRRWQFINPTSLTAGNQWEFDDYGRVQAVNQTPPPSYKPRRLPMEKMLLFRTEVEYDNPEAKSVLRSMYQPWYYATQLAEVEAIGAERLGVGFPVAYMGTALSRTGANSDLAALKDFVVNLRTDEQMGIVVPYPKMGSGDHGGQDALIELLSPPSRGFVDFGEVIGRWEQRMAMTVLAQFIFLGMGRVGTQALGQTLTDFFVEAVGAWSDSVADVINRFAVPRLFALNGLVREDLPELRHSEVGVPNLAGISDYVNKLVGAQVIAPYDELERHLLELADLPEKPESEELPTITEPVQESEESAEEFALRLKQGGPKWERATNEYQRKLQDAYDDWADETAREIAQIIDEREREEKLEKRVTALILLLLLIGREELPKALAYGSAGEPASPDGLADVAAAVRENEAYLQDSLGPAIRDKVRRAWLEDPLAALDVVTLRSVLGTFFSRVGNYAGQFWSLIMRGFLDRLKGRPDADAVEVRHVLDDRAKHCDECPTIAGEYLNWQAYMAATSGRVPGQFQCVSNCRCHLEFKIPGKGWGRW